VALEQHDTVHRNGHWLSIARRENIEDLDTATISHTPQRHVPSKLSIVHGKASVAERVLQPCGETSEPTFRLKHVDLLDTNCAIPKKYSSQLGRVSFFAMSLFSFILP